MSFAAIPCAFPRVQAVLFRPVSCCLETNVVTPRSGVSPNSVWRRYRLGVDHSVEGTALLREGVKKLLKMLIHFTMACTGNVGIPEVVLKFLREFKTDGRTTKPLLRATGIHSLHQYGSSCITDST